LVRRGEQMRDRRQICKAEQEEQERADQTFAPAINSRASAGRSPAESNMPAHERLYAKAPTSPFSPLKAFGGYGSPAASPNRYEQALVCPSNRDIVSVSTLRRPLRHSRH